MKIMEKVLKVLISKDVTESIFKFLSYLIACSATLNMAKYSITHIGIWSAVSFVVLFLVLLTLAFFYGLINIVFPVGQGIWPKVNYEKDLDYLLSLDRETNRRVAKVIFFSFPTMFAAILYGFLFFFMNKFIGVLIAQLGIAQ